MRLHLEQAFFRADSSPAPCISQKTIIKSFRIYGASQISFDIKISEMFTGRFHPTFRLRQLADRQTPLFYASPIFLQLKGKGATLFSTSHSSIILLLPEKVN